MGTTKVKCYVLAAEREISEGRASEEFLDFYYPAVNCRSERLSVTSLSLFSVSFCLLCLNVKCT